MTTLELKLNLPDNPTITLDTGVLSVEQSMVQLLEANHHAIPDCPSWTLK